LRADPKQGLQSEVNRYAELASFGIKVAFHSDSEEGAADLPIAALYAISLGFSPDVALRALTSDAADMLGLTQRVGRLAPGLDGDVLVLDGDPLDPRTSVLRAFVNGEEVR
jgi:imidazolonepropionase-like amidohydrolase